MKKEELILKVSELETKLKKANYDKDNLLWIASKIIKWQEKEIYSYAIVRDDKRIETFEELFFEIWKLVEFRDNVLEKVWYERRLQDNEKELNFLRNKENWQLI